MKLDLSPFRSSVTAYAYDAAGQLLSVTDALGAVTSNEYDNLGRQTKITQADPDDAGPLTSPETTFIYDAVGNLTSTTDPLSRTTSYAYDNLGRQTSVTAPDPDGAGPLSAPVTSTIYDAANQLTSVTDPLGNVTSYAYDDLGRTTSVTQADPDGGGPLAAPVTSFTYDALSRLLTTTDALNNVTSNQYDNLGRRTKLIQPDPDGAGPLTAPETTFTYDSLGKLLSVTDPLSQTTSYAYDDLGRTTRVTDPLAGVTSYDYDAVGNRLSLTDSLGNATTWVYDDLYRVTSETNQLNQTRTFTFDAMGALTSRIDRIGREIQYSYDNLQRLSQQQWLDVSQTLVNTVDFSYDAAGQMLTAADDVSAYAFTYDNLGRTTSVDNSGTPGAPVVVLSSSYDALGNRTQLAAEIDGVDDFVNDYSYDNLFRNTGVQQSGQIGGNVVADKRVDFTYDADGRFSQIDRYADLSATQLVANTSYTYDDTGRLTDLVHAKGANTLATYNWTFDADGRVTSFDSNDGLVNYSYDSTGQLTGADYDYQTDETYTYDANGNRTVSGYTTGANNRLTSDGAYDYTYDDEGNRTRKTNIATGEYTDYTWDHLNRLVGIENRDTAGVLLKEVQYTYDLFGSRIGKAIDSDADGVFETEEHYVYDGLRAQRGNAGDHIVLAFDGSGDLTNRYLHGPAVDQILADEQVVDLLTAGDVLWPLSDNLGSIRDLASYDDVLDITTVANHIIYDAFGNITSETDTAVDHLFAFTGRERDEESDLQYNRARYYDATTGRWISEDPLSFAAGDANLARYVGNRATNYLDPSGLDDLIGPFIPSDESDMTPEEQDEELRRLANERSLEETRLEDEEYLREHQPDPALCRTYDCLEGHHDNNGIIPIEPAPSVPPVYDLDDLEEVLTGIAASTAAKEEASRIAEAINNTWDYNFKTDLAIISEKAKGYYCWEWSYAFEDACNSESPEFFTMEVEAWGDFVSKKTHSFVCITCIETGETIFVDDGFMGDLGHIHTSRPIGGIYQNPFDLVDELSREQSDIPPVKTSHDDPLLDIPLMWGP